MVREKLPNRRAAITMGFVHRLTSGAEYLYTATLGYYPDGRLGEVFIEAEKIGTDLDVAVSDSAVAVSIALQHGCNVATLASAFLIREDGSPDGVLGTLFSILDKNGIPAAPHKAAIRSIIHDKPGGDKP